MSTIAEKMAGLSFAARAVYGMALAVTFETAEEGGSITEIRCALGLSDAAMTDVVGELFDAALAWTVADKGGDFALLETWHTVQFLSRAMGPAGRPRAADWGDLRTRTFAEKGTHCVYCRSHADAVDHIRPIARGGSNHPANLVPSCGTCNASKGAKTFEEWRR